MERSKIQKFLKIAYQIIFLMILGYTAVEIRTIKNITNKGLEEIDFRTSKLDYVDSDVNLHNTNQK